MNQFAGRRPAQGLRDVLGQQLQRADGLHPPATGRGEVGDELVDDAEQVRQLVRRVAPTTVDVIVTGPAGSGRTLAARAIHAGSPRAMQDLVMIDRTQARSRENRSWSGR